MVTSTPADVAGATGVVEKPRALRRDAAENRERLLSAARELFAEHGSEVTLDDIARHAGVGVGTAYRRFANKTELLAAIFADQTVELAAVADAGLADPDPWHGLVSYLEDVARPPAPRPRPRADRQRRPDQYGATRLQP